MIKFIVASLLVGIYAVVMAKSVELAFALFSAYSKIIGLWILIVIPIGALFTVYLTHNYLKEADGGGIGPVLAIAHSFSDSLCERLLNIKTVFAKLIVTPIGTLFGATIGREGPTIQASAAIFYILNKTSNEFERKRITLIGAGAGLAAAFNAPLGGIVYIFEELIKNDYDKKLYLQIIFGVAFSGLVSALIIGNHTYFGRVDRGVLAYDYLIYIFCAAVGIICGILSFMFTKFIDYFSSTNNSLGYWHKSNPYKSALIGGFLIAACGLVTLGYSFGNGYIEIKDALSGQEQLPWWYFAAKMAGSIFSQFAAIPGGYFSTSLSIGGGVGALFAEFFTSVNKEQLLLLGMIGFLAALTQAPITSMALILQVAFTQAFALPLAICAAIAAGVSYLLDKESIYEKQAKAYF